jgi:hypothetical protein
LSSKFQSTEFATAQLLPEHIFNGSTLRSQSSREVDQGFGHKAQFGRGFLRSQPLTRRHLAAPSPSGRGLANWEVKR